MTPPRQLLRSLALLLFLGLAASLPAAPIKFDIPAQPAPAAIEAFIKQSGTRVAYVEADLGQVIANAVVGEYEPAQALALLLKDTGCTISERRAGWFSVARPSSRPGSVEGAVRDESGRPVPNARVSLAGAEASVVTDRRGRFTLAEVPPGTHELQVSAEGMQNTRVTDVSVKAGHRLTLSSIVLPAKSSSLVQFEEYVVSAKKNDGLFELDPHLVESRRAQPFVDGNLDLPRTMDDVQPYHIFDAKALELSGAVDVEEFLKQRLPMNTLAQTNSQISATNTTGNQLGATSSIDLRGTGATLVLIDGRPAAGVTAQGTGITNSTIAEFQPDLNGIPMNAIERIEILPTSASAIYGGNAVGGVVNVVLKKNFQGGQVSFRYGNPWGKHAPSRNVGLTYGQSLEDGRTRFSITTAWSDAQPNRFGHVAEGHRRYEARAFANNPNLYATATTPPWGALTNISASSAAVTELTFRGSNAPLGSRISYVPAGIGPNTTMAELQAALLANAGQVNTDFPDNESPRGLRRRLGSATERRSIGFSLNRKMWANVEAHASYSYNVNDSTTRTVMNGQWIIQGTNPINPFNQTVVLRVPHSIGRDRTHSSVSKMVTGGVIARLPADWMVTADYRWSQSRTSFFTQNPALIASIHLDPAIAAGLQPFSDPALIDADLLMQSVTPSYGYGRAISNAWAVRGSGPLFNLPWGQPRLVAGGDYSITEIPGNVTHYMAAAGPRIITFFPREQTVLAGYSEVSVPLVKQAVLPLMHSLEMQLAGRVGRYEQTGGTRFSQLAVETGQVTYNGPVSNTGGTPFTNKSSYGSRNLTAGFKYEPFRDLALRASFGTAFRAPTAEQLIKDEEYVRTNPIDDPLTGQRYSVDSLGGGNPDLRPQSSESLNLGIIWAPKSGWFRDLRVNAEYFRIEEFDAVYFPDVQYIIDNESLFPERVIRGDDGRISVVEINAMNAFERFTEGWDFNVSYFRLTNWGRFTLSAAHSMAVRSRTQFSPTAPPNERVGFSPADGGQGPKHKGNLRLEWDHKAWNVSWSARYFDSYKQRGAEGGPLWNSVNGNLTQTQRAHLITQGGDTVSSQVFHDVVVGYAFGRNTPIGSARRWHNALLSGVSVQFGVRNVLNDVPSFDAFYEYFSPYGDAAPRSYWVSLKKSF